MVNKILTCDYSLWIVFISVPFLFYYNSYNVSSSFLNFLNKANCWKFENCWSWKLWVSIAEYLDDVNHSTIPKARSLQSPYFILMDIPQLITYFLLLSTRPSLSTLPFAPQCFRKTGKSDLNHCTCLL